MSSSDLETVRDQLKQAMDGTIGVKNPKPDVLDSAQEAALSTARLLESCPEQDRPEQMKAIGDNLPGSLRAWLCELPSFLSKKGRREQGDELCEVFSPILGVAAMDAEKVAVRYEAGEKAEALADVDAALEEHGQHPWILYRSGQLHTQHGDLRRARKDFETALEASRASDDRDQLRYVYDGAITFLQEHGETGEAMELSEQMMQDLPELEEEFRTEQIVNDAPKLGRNDPCHCGSGKKFKKCHGR